MGDRTATCTKVYQLALIVKASGSCTSHPKHDEFRMLVAACPSPDAHLQDTQLFDIPSASLSPSCPRNSAISIDCPVSFDVSSALRNIGLVHLDVENAVCQLKKELPSIWELLQPWKYWKYVEEPEYGPGPPLCILFFKTDLEVDDDLVLPGSAQWLAPHTAWKYLTEKDSHAMRLGPLATYAFSPHFPQGLLQKFNLVVKGQEYPPGVLQVPMTSLTAKPFSKTNLVIFASSNTCQEDALVVAKGNALLVDPGCHTQGAQAHLATVVKSLPKDLLIFLTHHHLDHMEGLQTVRKQNPQALLIAHELTFGRLGKAVKGFNYLAVVDGSVLLVGDQHLRVIAAPGHTDGHMALLHVPTQTLIVGDHCVGQGSSLLDADSGGNMQDYLATTRNFLNLAPRIIVPMHGRFNLWPAHLLNSYIRHREAREAKILSVIEQGARRAFDIVSQAYSDAPPALWTAALSNTKLHVEHLCQQQKLPQGFSMASFRKSCGLPFYLRYLPRASTHFYYLNWLKRRKALTKASFGMLLGCIFYWWFRKQLLS